MTIDAAVVRDRLRHATVRGAVAVWSDGWGRFYAAVPGDRPDPRRAARDAIRRELAARDAIGTGHRVRVERAPVEWHTTTDVDARPVFREVTA